MIDEITINVTQEHIARGERHNPKCCAIAQALIEGVNAIDPWVDDDSVLWYDSEQCLEMKALLPEDAREFMSMFDDGKTVKPISFVIAPYYSVMDYPAEDYLHELWSANE